MNLKKFIGILLALWVVPAMAQEESEVTVKAARAMYFNNKEELKITKGGILNGDNYKKV